jgi:hypothetical protein
VIVVQRRSGSRRALLASVTLTVLAAVLVLMASAVPSRLADLQPDAFVRLPAEGVVYLAVVLALPSHRRSLQTALAVAAGAVLGLAAVFRILDLGSGEALSRPFDPLIDWRYAGSLVETLRGSVGGVRGSALVGLAGVVVLALLVLLPLSVLRVSRVVLGRRRVAVGLAAGLACLWLLLGLLDLRTMGQPVASRQTAGYVYGELSRIPSELRDQREFAGAARTDPVRRVPPAGLLAGLRGKDVLIVFVESYGRVAVDGSSFSPGVDRVLDSGTRQLDRAGFGSRSAFLTSPTFGGISWLAHSTLQSGLWVDSQERYDQLLTSPRLTLSRLFAGAGWRTVADIPADNRDWPQGAFYGFDHVYDSRNVGYRGPRFGYPTMPDQYTLDAFHRLELAPTPRRPVMAELDLISSHAPWAVTPRMVAQSAVGDGSVFDGMPEQLPTQAEVWRSPQGVRTAYGQSIEYSLRALVSFLTTYGNDNLVMVVLGDHQPATIVSGKDAGHDVPVTVLARDRAVLARISGWDWTPGLRPASDAPVWRMDTFRDRLLAAYGAGGPAATLP